MEPIISSFNWADYGIAGGFIAFLIFQWWMGRKERADADERAAQREEALRLELTASQNARIEEGKENQKELFEGLQLLAQAVDILKTIRAK